MRRTGSRTTSSSMYSICGFRESPLSACAGMCTAAASCGSRDKATRAPAALSAACPAADCPARNLTIYRASCAKLVAANPITTNTTASSVFMSLALMHFPSSMDLDVTGLGRDRAFGRRRFGPENSQVDPEEAVCTIWESFSRFRSAAGAVSGSDGREPASDYARPSGFAQFPPEGQLPRAIPPRAPRAR